MGERVVCRVCHCCRPEYGPGLCQSCCDNALWPCARHGCTSKRGLRGHRARYCSRRCGEIARHPERRPRQPGERALVRAVVAAAEVVIGRDPVVAGNELDALAAAVADLVYRVPWVEQ